MFNDPNSQLIMLTLTKIVDFAVADGWKCYKITHKLLPSLILHTYHVLLIPWIHILNKGHPKTHLGREVVNLSSQQFDRLIKRANTWCKSRVLFVPTSMVPICCNCSMWGAKRTSKYSIISLTGNTDSTYPRHAINRVTSLDWNEIQFYLINLYLISHLNTDFIYSSHFSE